MWHRGAGSRPVQASSSRINWTVTHNGKVYGKLLGYIIITVTGINTTFQINVFITCYVIIVILSYHVLLKRFKGIHVHVIYKGG